MHFVITTLSFLIFILFRAHALTPATIPQLGDIVIGRCFETAVLNAKLLNNRPPIAIVDPQDMLVDCPALFSNFSSVWKYRDPLSVTFQDFTPFFDQLAMNELMFVTPEDRALFWSNTDRFAHVLSTNYPQSFMTLEDTIVGKSLNGLTFCGCSDSTGSREGCRDGIEYGVECPWGTVVSINETIGVSVSFWAQASAQFARHVKGTIQVLLSSSPWGKAYEPGSFFGTFEIPNLPAAVTKVRVLLIKNETVGETCHRGSILRLKEDVKKRFMELGVAQLPPVECIDDFATLKHIICADAPQSSQCTFVSRVETGSTKRRIALFSLSSFVIGFIVGTMVVLLTMVVHSFVFQHRKIQCSTLYQPLATETAQP